MRGEVQRITTSRTGHTYFELVEKDSRRERVAARIDVALFKGNAPTINTRLREVPGVTLAPDIELRIRGRIDYYPTGGRLQLVMTDIDPIFTVGGMAANRERVLRALAAEDLLQRNGGLPLSPVPLRVGLITSKGSAAYYDFVHELERSGFDWRVVLADVRVQGGGAPRRVTWALRAFASVDVDVVVVVRGGGARSDLAAFDSEPVARAIALMPMPVFTGIGHEIDRAVADEVAHSCFNTPTACAQALVEQVCTYLDRMTVLSNDVVTSAAAAAGHGSPHGRGCGSPGIAHSPVPVFARVRRPRPWPPARARAARRLRSCESGVCWSGAAVEPRRSRAAACETPTPSSGATSRRSRQRGIACRATLLVISRASRPVSARSIRYASSSAAIRSPARMAGW